MELQYNKDITSCQDKEATTSMNVFYNVAHAGFLIKALALIVFQTAGKTLDKMV